MIKMVHLWGESGSLLPYKGRGDGGDATRLSKMPQKLGVRQPVNRRSRVRTRPTVIPIPQGREKNHGSISTDPSGKNREMF